MKIRFTLRWLLLLILFVAILLVVQRGLHSYMQFRSQEHNYSVLAYIKLGEIRKEEEKIPKIEIMIKEQMELIESTSEERMRAGSMKDLARLNEILQARRTKVRSLREELAEYKSKQAHFRALARWSLLPWGPRTQTGPETQTP